MYKIVPVAEDEARSCGDRLFQPQAKLVKPFQALTMQHVQLCLHT